MSGTASVTNTFGGQTGPLLLSLLDANYADLVTYLNNPTNRYNYGSSGGDTASVTITCTPAIAGYTAGLELSWTWPATVAGAITIDAGPGAKNVVNSDGSAMLAGQGLTGSVGKGIYDGTRFIFITPPAPATQAAMKTATTVGTFVSPAQMQNHPGVAKAWATWVGTSTGTITANGSYNVSTIAREGTGTYSISFTTPMTTTAYPVVGSCTSGGYTGLPIARATSTFSLVTTNGTAPIDADVVDFVAYGTQ